MRRVRTTVMGFALVVLALSVTGCDAFESINPFNNEKEVTGIVELIGDTSLTVDGIEYQVTDQTEFEGIDSLAELAVGDEVEIGYEENGGSRTALEIDKKS